MAAETIHSEVHLVFRKKTHGQIIGDELQEGFSHIGTAVTEAGRAAAEQLGPRVEAAREAAAPALGAAQKAVAPRMAAAAAVAAPAVASARDAFGPRVEAARGAAAPRVASAMVAAQEAAARAAADLGPRLEAAREAAHKALEHDVAPRVGAAQTAALAYATPKVIAARQAVTPALEHARDTISASLEHVLDELEVRRAELAATTPKARKQVAKRRRKLEKKAAKTAGRAKKQIGAEPQPRRWPWLAAVLAISAVVIVVLRRKKDDSSWTPAPAGDGPVPTYREDPAPRSPSTPEKTVSAAQTSPGDATPPDSDLGMQTAQPAGGPDWNRDTDVPGAASGGPADPALTTSTAGPGSTEPTASEGTEAVNPETDSTNTTGTARGPAGTPLADRGQEPEDGATRA